MKAFIALVFLVGAALAADPASTTLAPTGGPAGRGQTNLTPTPNSPPPQAQPGFRGGECASPPCGGIGFGAGFGRPTIFNPPCMNPPCADLIGGWDRDRRLGFGACATPPCDNKPMHPAKIDLPTPCGCIDDPICDCRHTETVKPEIRDVYRGCPCLGQVGCGCTGYNGHVGFRHKLVSDGCGCLHLAVCPCRPKFIEPQIEDRHLEPELKEKRFESCGCLMEAVCACRRHDHVVPEIRENPCGCRDDLTILLADCPCRRQFILRPN